MLRRLLARFRLLWRSDRYEAELREELEFLLAEEEHERLAAGQSAEEARRAARRDFGNLSSIRSRTRDQRIWPWWQNLGLDLRLAVRTLVKGRWLALTTVLTLGLGIGVNTAMFTFINTWILRDLPILEPDRVVYLWTRSESGRGARTSVPDYEDWREHARSFSDLAAVYDAQSVNLGDADRVSMRVRAGFVSANLFSVIGQRPLEGRGFSDADDRPGAFPVAIIGHGLWQNHYGGDPGVVGRTVRANGVVATVIGVMPPGMHFPSNVELWMPLAQLPSDLPSAARDHRILRVFGRLRDEVSVEQAGVELAGIGRQLGIAHPATDAQVGPAVMPFDGAVRGADAPAAAFVQTLVLFVLLIAGANVACLLLVRGVRRSGEMTIRASLGASRWRVVRQLLAESVVLATASAVVGLALSVPALRWWLLVAAQQPGPYGLPFQFTMDGIVWAFVAALWLLTVGLRTRAGLVGLEDRSEHRAQRGRSRHRRPSCPPMDEWSHRWRAGADSDVAGRRRFHGPLPARPVLGGPRHRSEAHSHHAHLDGAAEVRRHREASGSVSAARGPSRRHPGDRSQCDGHVRAVSVRRKTSSQCRRAAARPRA